MKLDVDWLDRHSAQYSAANRLNLPAMGEKILRLLRDGGPATRAQILSGLSLVVDGKPTCPSDDMLVTWLRDLRKAGLVRTHGRGEKATWSLVDVRRT